MISLYLDGPSWVVKTADEGGWYTHKYYDLCLAYQGRIDAWQWRTDRSWKVLLKEGLTSWT